MYVVVQEEIKKPTHLFWGVGAGESHQGPEQDAHAHDVLPVVPVAQVTKHRSQEHVAADKNWNRQEHSELILIHILHLYIYIHKYYINIQMCTIMIMNIIINKVELAS